MPEKYSVSCMGMKQGAKEHRVLSTTKSILKVRMNSENVHKNSVFSPQVLP
jgi:hypothetical protein